jgi:hypothetical protein
LGRDDPTRTRWPRRRAVAATLAFLAALVVAIAFVLLAPTRSEDAKITAGRAPSSVALPSTDPYEASLAYASCLRARGVPHPDPDRHGDFKLTPAQERRLRSIDAKKRKAAEDACFRHLKGLNLRPLSKAATTRAKDVLADFAACIRGKGYRAGPPVVENLPRGRARFGLKDPPGTHARGYWNSPAGKKQRRVMLACETEVDMARRVSKIIDEDRRVDGL